MILTAPRDEAALRALGLKQLGAIAISVAYDKETGAPTTYTVPDKLDLSGYDDEVARLASTPKPLSFLAFMALFTDVEQAAIVSSSDIQIRLFCLMAAGASFVDLGDPRVVAGTRQLETLGLIGSGRAVQVLGAHAPSTSASVPAASGETGASAN